MLRPERFIFVSSKLAAGVLRMEKKNVDYIQK